jgi:hypothetical protein
VSALLGALTTTVDDVICAATYAENHFVACS